MSGSSPAREGSADSPGSGSSRSISHSERNVQDTGGDCRVQAGALVMLALNVRSRTLSLMPQTEGSHCVL
jgi:hypothetical protein